MTPNHRILWAVALLLLTPATLAAGPKSVGALAFGPGDVLFVADSEGAAVYAVKTGLEASSSTEAMEPIPDFDAKLDFDPIPVAILQPPAFFEIDIKILFGEPGAEGRIDTFLQMLKEDHSLKALFHGAERVFLHGPAGVAAQTGMDMRIRKEIDSHGRGAIVLLVRDRTLTAGAGRSV